MAAARWISRPLVIVLLTLGLLGVVVWTIGFLYYVVAPPGWGRALASGLYLGTLFVLIAIPGTRDLAPWLAIGVFLVALVWFLSLRPSNERMWNPREAKLASAEIDGDRLTIHNVRNFRFRSTDDFDERWETRTYDLAKFESVWFVLAKFKEIALGAHTFVSFGFTGGEYLALSIEARKQVGERYGLLPGLYRRFETIYIAGDERDLIGLRTHVYQDEVFLYPIRSTPDGRRAFLLDMLERMNQLGAKPSFYNTLVDSCATGLHEHLKRVRPEPTRMSYEVFVPAFADRRVFDLGLIDTTGTLPEARRRFRVDPGPTTPDDPDYSAAIRRG